jgi:ABC-type amino acid transport substrate-binding protein
VRQAEYLIESNHAGNAIVVTDGGCCTTETLKAAADDLRALGVTVIAVGISGFDMTVLEAIASESGGKKLVFTGAEFDQIETLLLDALADIGT